MSEKMVATWLTCMKNSLGLPTKVGALLSVKHSTISRVRIISSDAYTRSSFSRRSGIDLSTTLTESPWESTTHAKQSASRWSDLAAT